MSNTPRTDAIFDAYAVDMDGVSLRETVAALERDLAAARLELMKFGDCVLRKAGNVQVGDEVVFKLDCVNYTVEHTSMTSAGRNIHWHETGSNSYWPDEMVFVRDAANEGLK